MPEYDGNDIYCDLIIPGKLPVEIVKETDTVLAFRHTKPRWPVHIVVTPKRHIESLLSLPDEPELMGELLGMVKEVSQGVLDATSASRLLTNLGTYQDSKHLHFHITSGEPL